MADALADEQKPQPSYLSYCGIQAVYRAMLSLGTDVPFKKLIDRTYLGSSEGSSMTELSRAARDNGLYTLPLYHMRHAVLYDVRDPMILHIKVRPGGSVFNHWVLFMGMEGGKARICDRFSPMSEMPLEELSERWDGNGLVISNHEISAFSVYVTSISVFAFNALLAGALVGFLRFVQKWGVGRRDANSPMRWSPSAVRETCLLDSRSGTGRLRLSFNCT